MVSRAVTGVVAAPAHASGLQLFAEGQLGRERRVVEEPRILGVIFLRLVGLAVAIRDASGEVSVRVHASLVLRVLLRREYFEALGFAVEASSSACLGGWPWRPSIGGLGVGRRRP